MRIEHLLDVPPIVLRAHAQYDAALLELLRVLLQGQMRLAEGATLAEHDAVNAVIAEDAAPKRVVEVENQAFARPPEHGADQTREQAPVARCGCRRDLQLALQPMPRIEPCVEPIPRACRRNVQQELAMGGGGIGDAVVQARDQPRRRARYETLVVAEQRRG